MPRQHKGGERSNAKYMFSIGFFSSGLLAPTRVSGCLRMTENSAGEQGYSPNIEYFK